MSVKGILGRADIRDRRAPKRERVAFELRSEIRVHGYGSPVTHASGRRWEVVDRERMPTTRVAAGPILDVP
jgi:hypothetical protein